jgi:hypothetical protein
MTEIFKELRDLAVGLSTLTERVAITSESHAEVRGILLSIQKIEDKIASLESKVTSLEELDKENKSKSWSRLKFWLPFLFTVLIAFVGLYLKR